MLSIKEQEGGERSQKTSLAVVKLVVDGVVVIAAATTTTSRTIEAETSSAAAITIQKLLASHSESAAGTKEDGEGVDFGPSQEGDEKRARG